MTAEVLAFLVQDGLTTGTIYVLLAIALVLVFVVTRVLFIPQGELVSYSALTLAMFERGLVAPTVWLTALLGLLCAIQDIYRWRIDQTSRISLLGLAGKVGVPIAILCVAYSVNLKAAPHAVLILLTLLVVAPLASYLYQIVFEPASSAPILVLMIMAMALHLVLAGIALSLFGPEGWRTEPIVSGSISFGYLIAPVQAIVTIVVSLLVVLGLLLIFETTLLGKALRATAINRRGAEIVGINPSYAGQLAFLCAGILGALSGILISPITTIYYDTGFLIGLKGFTGAVLGGLSGYAAAALGAISIGFAESIAAFYASEYKEVIVFALILPVLLIRSLRTVVLEDEDDE